MLIVYGTVCLDRTRRVAHLPHPGEYVEVESELVRIGGEAWNTAKALGLWGARPMLAGNRVRALSEIADADCGGMDCSYMEEDGRELATCDIYVTPDGERTMFGAGFQGIPSRAGAAPAPGPGWWVTTDANLGAVSESVRQAARAAGARTYAMDALEESGAIADVWQSSTDVVGHRGDLQRNLDWIRRRAQETAQLAILSDAANGFVAGGRTPEGAWIEPRHFPPFPCPGIVDTTGAGDTFRAGMLLGLAGGWPIGDCLRFASAAGCLNCARWTASGDLPTRDEVEAHIAASPAVAAAY